MRIVKKSIEMNMAIESTLRELSIVVDYGGPLRESAGDFRKILFVISGKIW